jgi:hypothetical protein
LQKKPDGHRPSTHYGQQRVNYFENTIGEGAAAESVCVARKYRKAQFDNFATDWAISASARCSPPDSPFVRLPKRRQIDRGTVARTADRGARAPFVACPSAKRRLSPQTLRERRGASHQKVPFTRAGIQLLLVYGRRRPWRTRHHLLIGSRPSRPEQDVYRTQRSGGFQRFGAPKYPVYPTL